MEIKETTTFLKGELKSRKWYFISFLIIFLCSLAILLLSVSDGTITKFGGLVISEIVMMIGTYLGSLFCIFPTYEKMKLKIDIKIVCIALMPIVCNIFIILQINKFLKNYDDKVENTENRVQ